MCYRVEVKAGIEDIAKRFRAQFQNADLFNFADEINGFAHDVHPVITNHDSYIIQPDYEWGLIPDWCKDDSIRKNTLNAKIETLEQKPAFKNVISNRCLVIATAYYEWRWNDEKGKSKQKFKIHSSEEEIFAFAGIYSKWTSPETGNSLNTFSIVTTAANQQMQYIHNNKQRMPLMLRRQDELSWLDPQVNYQDFGYPNYNAPIVAFEA